ncbi:hypothetical protein AAFF_G00069400 [Aldrovandia affinis]|uniref:Uncharacterized protein n=1 Tax=Aldrovandia affinis TaxID=143900 RepID=A0AAD7S1M2_9TELE|nr:hypothetical protein AAFF_G00069400 [Aldrovandia affinis]
MQLGCNSTQKSRFVSKEWLWSTGVTVNSLVACCLAALLVTAQTKDKAETVHSTTLKIPHNYQVASPGVLEGNGNIHARSLSAWTWRVNFQENRIPKAIHEAVCSSSYCLHPKYGRARDEMNEELNSVPIHQELLVLHLNKTLNVYQASHLSVAVGCTCVRARIA